MQKTAVLNIVGLTPSLIAEHAPNIRALRDSGAAATIRPALPAVTCTAQTDYLTGFRPAQHGIVGNGWYFRNTQEVRFWQQAAGLVGKPRVWDLARQRSSRFTCANLFWWYAMYCGADWTVTPRPMYLADGRKIPDIWTNPPTLRAELQRELGQFPLFKFWGPAAGIESSRWIAEAALMIDRRFDPTLTLVYLPHLDYCLQKYGPRAPEVAAELSAIDELAGRLIDHFHSRGARVIVLSEYGVTAVSRPVHLNRLLRSAGMLQIRQELGTDRLDAGASGAFAVADHQIAHVYVRNTRDLPRVIELVRAAPGVARVLTHADKIECGLDHANSGDLLVLAEPDAWFTYYFWEDDARAPDYARTVDIHRKPGYDPVELFLDYQKPAIKARIFSKLLARKLGFATLLNVIPLDAGLVRGSHGLPGKPENGPVLLTNCPAQVSGASLASTEVADVILRHVFET